jgi:putative ABC transport system permease protein
MLRNYLKVALRYLLRYKQYTAINIMGLAVGIACCILIMLFVRSEFSYDRFNSKADRIYRLWQFEKYEDQQFINTSTPVSAAPVIQANFPEVESVCRIYDFSPVIRINDKSFSEPIRMVDSTFFRVFDFTLLGGNRNNPFPSSNSVILTKETAKKYFGTVNPMGKQLEIQLDTEKELFTVVGIAQKAPEASSVKFNLLIPFSNDKKLFGKNALRSWFNVSIESYIVTKQNVSGTAVEKKFPSMVKQYLGEEYKEGAFVFHLQPITDIHLNPALPAGIEPISNPKYSYILGSIGIAILLIACINFITLSVGRSATRAMEVGVRKVLGAERQQLIRQFWSEAFLLTLISVIIGLALAWIALPWFNQITDKALVLQFDRTFILFSVLMIAVIAMIAGIYPAIILSGFRPVEVLKGKLNLKNNTGWLRQSLVVGQFIASIAMIVCNIMISKQMSYLRTKDLGYAKEQVVIVPTNMGRKAGIPLAELYRAELLKHPEVSDAAVSIFTFAEPSWAEIGYTDDKRAYHSFQFNSIDANFTNTMKIAIVQGRSFEPGNMADQTTAALVNEAFIKEFGLKDPIGKKLPGPFQQQIIGVMKDFNYQSLHTKVVPLMLTIQPDSVLRKTENINFQVSPQPRISVRLKAGNMVTNMAVLQQAWKVVAPTKDFEYTFLDDKIANQYIKEQRTGTVVKIASALSIFIACMGLFGLATLSVVRRTKEIGIRKVLGASVGTIVQLLSKDFLKPVLVAAIIAFPLAWWFIQDWLKDFAYKASVSWWVFAIAGVMAALVALITIGFQAITAATANPVKSLRSE